MSYDQRFIAVSDEAYDATSWDGITTISASKNALRDKIQTLVISGGALGTPSSGTLTNCTFPTLNQNSIGSSASLSVSGQTGLLTITGLTSTNRIKTIRDAADTILELGGSYTPTGTWTNLTLVNPALGTPASGVVTNLTGTASISINGTVGATTPAAGTFTTVTTLIIKPSSDSTTAVKITKSDGSTAVGTWDTTNSRLGIGIAPLYTLDVSGKLRAVGNDTQLIVDRSSSSQYAEFQFRTANGSTPEWILGTRASSTDFVVRANNTTNVFTATTGGAVTITGTLSVTGASTLTGGIVGTTAAGNATAGNLGEVVSSLVAVGSPVSLTTATAADVTSISLTAGDWDVEANVNFTETTATVSARSAGISTTSAALPADGSEAYCGVQSTITSETNTITLPRKRINVSTTTTVYLVGKATFSAGTCGGFGAITARRIR